MIIIDKHKIINLSYYFCFLTTNGSVDELVLSK